MVALCFSCCGVGVGGLCCCCVGVRHSVWVVFVWLLVCRDLSCFELSYCVVVL